MNYGQEATIFLLIFTVWSLSLYIRVYDKKLKKYTAAMVFCIIFWMILRLIRHFAPSQLSVYMWYLYYIPLLFIPTFYYNCSAYLQNRNNDKRRQLVIAVSTFLVLFVLTNNLHYFVFSEVDKNGIYEHRIGYYLICFWIFSLLVLAIKNLVKISGRQKEKYKMFLPFIPLGLGGIYTVLYVLNVPWIRHTNMSIISDALFCVGLEILFRLDLIPNNIHYKKIFENSHLPLEVLSSDGEKRFQTNHKIEVVEKIKEDIVNKQVKEKYQKKTKVQNVKTIYGGYAVEEKDFSKIKKLKRRLQSTHQELLKQENLLKKQKKIKMEIYEMKLNREIAELLDQKIEEKKQEIHQTLEEMQEPDFEKMYHIKMLISYCKRMSSLVISNYRKEKYNQERMKLILEELLWDTKNQKVEGVIQINHFEITSSETIAIYEAVFEELILLKDIHFILNIEVTKAKMKFLFAKDMQNLKTKVEELHLEKILQVREKKDEEETKLELEFARGEKKIDVYPIIEPITVACASGDKDLL